MPERLFDRVYRIDPESGDTGSSNGSLVIHFMERNMGYRDREVMQRVQELDDSHTAVGIITFITIGADLSENFTQEEVDSAIKLFSEQAMESFREIFPTEEDYLGFAQGRGHVSAEDIAEALHNAIKADADRRNKRAREQSKL